MRLLVSVSDVSDALAALAGGADIIDAKDPEAGALGAVSADMLRLIHRAVNGARPVTAAIGEAGDEEAVERAARASTSAGAMLVKLGFAGVGDAERAGSLARAAVLGANRGARAAGRRGAAVAVVGYADANPSETLRPEALVGIAARAGATTVLIDTFDKTGPGLRQLVRPDELTGWINQAHERSLLVALAGKLTADDLPFIQGVGADVAGVRGAACTGGRGGHVMADRVRSLKTHCTSTPISSR